MSWILHRPRCVWDLGESLSNPLVNMCDVLQCGVVGDVVFARLDLLSLCRLEVDIGARQTDGRCQCQRTSAGQISNDQCREANHTVSHQGLSPPAPRWNKS